MEWKLPCCAARWRARFWFGIFALATAVVPLRYAEAQANVSMGSIAGTLTDEKGALATGVTVIISSQGTGKILRTSSNEYGNYSSGPLVPGRYLVRFEPKGMRIMELPFTVEVATVASGNVRLQAGDPSEVAEGQASDARVVNQQKAVQGLISSDQLEQLPSSRNFLDLTFLEPGVQVVDGAVLDPAKAGFTSVSIDGHLGRTTRYEVDGNDITDEFAGAPIQNLPVSGIDQIQVVRSGLDLPTELTSTGAVNIATKSGSNLLHGQGFGQFRDQSAGDAKLPGGLSHQFQRDVFGGSVGGAAIRDRLFGFLSGEYFKQDLRAPVLLNAPFNALSGSYSAPFRETELDGRVDYLLRGSGRLFYRFGYDNNNGADSTNGNTLQVYKSSNNVPSHTVGFDFNTGVRTHSLRFAYDKINSNTSDDVARRGVFDPLSGVSLNFANGSGFASGASPYAPSHTIQSNKEFKYDGSMPWRYHIFRYGLALNRVDGYSFANRYGLAPEVTLDTSPASQTYAAAHSAFAGGAANPLNYPVDSITLGNGFGCTSEKSAFGYSCGGEQGTRLQAYAGGLLKYHPNLTLTYGLIYSRETGRQNSDLGRIPCFASAGVAPCTGNGDLLQQFGYGSGLGGRVQQPNFNFAPQIGFAWDPANSGKTVIRGGWGIYYDTTVLNNILLDRSVRSATGRFNQLANDPCASHGVLLLPGMPGGVAIANDICKNSGSLLSSATNLPVGTVAPAIASLQQQFQAQTSTYAQNGANPAFVGQTLNASGTLASDYQTPRAVQFNLGFQKELHPGTVISLDFVHNHATRYLLGVDTNHVGDSRFLNINAALNAITNTVSPYGCPAATSVGASSQAAIDCYLSKAPTPGIAEFAAHGLDSGGQYLGGYPASAFGLTPDTGAAFPGVNPNVGRSVKYEPIGQSTYNALQIATRSRVLNPGRGVREMSLQIAYTYSKFSTNAPGTTGDDQALPLAEDFANPTFHMGPGAQDRTHQIAFGTVLNVVRGARVSILGHFASPLAQSLFLPTEAGVPGEIFRTDVGGDGAFGGQSLTGNSPYGDLLPFTKIGDYGHKTKASSLNDLIQRTYNSQFAGHITPAGAALVARTVNLFSSNGDPTRLARLGAVTPMLGVQPEPGDNLNLSWLKTLDLALSWPLKVGDRFTIEPRVSAFNVFNFANFDAGNNKLGGLLDGAPGDLNGTTPHNRAANRVGLGSGVYSQAAPRQLEFGVRVSF